MVPKHKKDTFRGRCLSRIEATDCTPHRAFPKRSVRRLTQLSSSLCNYNMVEGGLARFLWNVIKINSCYLTDFVQIIGVYTRKIKIDV